MSQSFVESAKDIKSVRQAARALNYDPFIIAKIERSRALDHLAEILDKLAYVIRERFKLLEFARTLSAQQKASAYCVAASPFVAALALTFGSPGWFDPLLAWKYGWMVLVGAVIWQLIGFLVLKRIANITV